MEEEVREDVLMEDSEYLELKSWDDRDTYELNRQEREALRIARLTGMIKTWQKKGRSGRGKGMRDTGTASIRQLLTTNISSRH